MNYQFANSLLPLVGLGLLILIPTNEAAAASGVAERCKRPPRTNVSISVKDTGAKGDGRTDDTAAIQRAINQVGGKGGTVFVPAGVYMVDTVANRIQLKSRMTLELSAGATLKAIPNASQHYSILTVSGGSHVNVVGGTLEGDRDLHQGTGGEWGMGISLLAGAQNIIISQVTAKNTWGDGFYIEGAKYVSLCSVVADKNRRQGLSIIDAQDVIVADAIFKNTRGTRPSSGIDMEPYKHEHKIANVRILGSKFLDNAGPGILISGSKHAHNISDVEITGNLFRGNPPIKIKYAPAVLDSAICRNRYVIRPEQASDLVMVADSQKEMIVTAACGDPALRTRQ